MAKLDGLESVLSFLKGLQPKIAAQIAKKIFGLAVEPKPQDSAALKGYDDLLRVDSGEFRIVYRHDEAEDVVLIVLIGKRNDDEVYKLLRRKMD